ncbi:hypothetical protein PMI42_04815 [Bradyrhizobium sp. YR681]|nr:hypothetical protein PMI42_04815 [Bradyrhizobium sp. YR681]
MATRLMPPRPRSEISVWAAVATAGAPRGTAASRLASAGAAQFSSDDGLGIHQPGSMTRGTRAKVQTPSGRARDRAMCPAVVRSFAGRAA